MTMAAPTLPTTATGAVAAPPSRRSGRRIHTPRLRNAGPLTYIALGLALLLSVFPLYWTLVVASQTNDVINNVPPELVPGSHLVKNINRVLDNQGTSFGKALVNSAIVATTVTVSVVFFSTLAGFAFAKLKFRGRNGLLVIIVLTMMVPMQLALLPLYILMAKLHWNGHLQAVIVPFMVSGFGVFLMRQYTMSAVPDELIEAARVDGCSTFRIYWSVILPAVRPGAAVLGLFTFMQTWNDFVWPLVTLGPQNPTVQVALRTLQNGYYEDQSQVLAATLVATLPLLAVFALLGRQLIGGLMEGAVKA
jgi:cellobiose transport system permease protein